MRLGNAWVIDLEYVQRMMAWLLFVEPDSVSERRALQLGLGAAALTKFAFRKLGMRTSCIELNPQVVAACRQWFRLPADSERLEVRIADAGLAIAEPEWQGVVDALQVDLYDQEAAAPVLDDAGFYARCRDTLTPDGCMTVNLFGRDSSFVRSVQRMAGAFGPGAVWCFRPTREGNTVVLALRDAASAPSPEGMQARAEVIRARWGLPAHKWIKVLRRLEDVPDVASMA